jgi:malonyl-CoA/methylmalonyl-CoA synthetase
MTTAAEFDELTGRYAAFIQSLGLEPGDRVAVQVEKSVQAVMLYLACLRAGVVYLPLNTAYRESEIAYFLGDAAPKVFVHSPKDAEWAAPAASMKIQKSRKNGEIGTQMPETTRQ